MGITSSFPWVECSEGQVPPYAVLAGDDETGRKVYVARGKLDEASIIGSLTEGEGSVSLPWDGREVRKIVYEILTAPIYSYRWEAASGGMVKAGAIKGGYDPVADGEQYYVGRVRKPGGGYACGKIHPSHECCYVSYGTKEHGFKNYEVLVKRSVPSALAESLENEDEETTLARALSLSLVEQGPPTAADRADVYGLSPFNRRADTTTNTTGSEVGGNGSERASCKICYGSPIQIVFNCGHGTCQGCSQRLETCHQCRQAISSRIRFYELE